MEWNPTSQTQYYFAVSPFCLPESSDYSAFPDKLIEFIDDANACNHACEYNNLLNVQCTPLDWQNGVCNDECNNENCYYDGGDCNQICEEYYPNCSMSEMFGNGICDIECNNTLCSYDVGECVVDQYSSIDISRLFGYNATYCDDLEDVHLCLIDWIDDGWCDNNCKRKQSCFYDANDCDCSNVENYCQQAFGMFDAFDDATTDEGDYYVSFAGFCNVWSLLAIYVSELFYEQFIEPYNCTTAFGMIDMDNNTYIDLYEFIYILNTYEVIEGVALTDTKYQQLNCSNCFAV